MLRGKENGGIPRKIHVRIYLFITRERVYTDPPHEIHFLYNEKFHFLFLVCFQTYMHHLSDTVCNKNPKPSLHLHSCRSPDFFLKKKTFIKRVLTNVKSLSVQVILDFPFTTFLIFLLPLCHVPCLLVNVPLQDSAGMPALDENFHHLSIRELGLVEQAANSAFVVRCLPVARRALCQTRRVLSAASSSGGAWVLPVLSKMEPFPIPPPTTSVCWKDHRNRPMVEPGTIPMFPAFLGKVSFRN